MAAGKEKAIADLQKKLTNYEKLSVKLSSELHNAHELFPGCVNLIKRKTVLAEAVI